MKILAIVATQGNSSIIRPEAEQFIEMHRRGVQVDIMCHKDTAYAQIFQDAGLNIVGNFPKNKKDKQAVAEIRLLLQNRSYAILHVLHRASIACGIKAAKGLPVKLVAYRGASGLYWHDITAYQNALHPRVDKVICVCNDIRDNLKKQLFFKKHKAITVYKGHRPEWYSGVQSIPLAEFNVPADAFVIACSANNRKWKGIPTFLDAIHQLPTHLKFCVLLLGNGMDTPYYTKKIAANANADKIRVLGFRDDALEIVKSSHVCMQTSYKNEGLSRSTVEAMCLGAVPIVTNAGGNAELVKDGECGLVVPVKNAPQMSAAIQQLYHNPNILQQYSVAALQRIRTHFSVEQTVEKTMDIYTNLLNKQQ